MIGAGVLAGYQFPVVNDVGLEIPFAAGDIAAGKLQRIDHVPLHLRVQDLILDIFSSSLVKMVIL